MEDALMPVVQRAELCQTLRLVHYHRRGYRGKT